MSQYCIFFQSCLPECIWLFYDIKYQAIGDWQESTMIFGVSKNLTRTRSHDCKSKSNSSVSLLYYSSGFCEHGGRLATSRSHESLLAEREQTTPMVCLYCGYLLTMIILSVAFVIGLFLLHSFGRKVSEHSVKAKMFYDANSWAKGWRKLLIILIYFNIETIPTGTASALRFYKNVSL